MKEFKISDPEISLLDGLKGKRIPLVLGKGKSAFGYERILLRTAQGKGVVFRCEPLEGSIPGKAFRIRAEEWNRKRDAVSGYITLDIEYSKATVGIVQYLWDDDLLIDEGFFLTEGEEGGLRTYFMPCGPLALAFCDDIQTAEGPIIGEENMTSFYLHETDGTYTVSMKLDSPFQGTFPPGRAVSILDDPPAGWRFAQFLSELIRR